MAAHINITTTSRRNVQKWTIHRFDLTDRPVIVRPSDIPVHRKSPGLPGQRFRGSHSDRTDA